MFHCIRQRRIVVHLIRVHNCPFVIEIMAVSDLEYVVDGMHEVPATLIQLDVPCRDSGVCKLDSTGRPCRRPAAQQNHFREHLSADSAPAPAPASSNCWSGSWKYAMTPTLSQSARVIHGIHDGWMDSGQGHLIQIYGYIRRE